MVIIFILCLILGSLVLISFESQWLMVGVCCSCVCVCRCRLCFDGCGQNMGLEDDYNGYVI